jgi:hypothetical protein
VSVPFSGRGRHLHDAFTVGTAQLGPYATDHQETGRHVHQHLGDVFAPLAQLTELGVALD